MEKVLLAIWLQICAADLEKTSSFIDYLFNVVGYVVRWKAILQPVVS
jgi:hypothetical protein